MCIGWTIEEWRGHQSSVSREEGLQTVLDLVTKLTEDSSPWSSIASADLIKSQWKNLTKLDHEKVKTVPLYGVPFAVKENIEVGGMQTNLHHISQNDATIVSLLREAGAILVGKTKLDIHDKCIATTFTYRNTPPEISLNDVVTSSRANSAYVVSRGFVPFSISTDTASSYRGAAALNNVIAFRLTSGMVSMKGIFIPSETSDSVTIFGIRITEIQEVFQVLAQFKDKSLLSSNKNCIFAVPYLPSQLGKDITSQSFNERTLEVFRDLGILAVSINLCDLNQLTKLLHDGSSNANQREAIQEFVTSYEEDRCSTVVHIAKQINDALAKSDTRNENINQTISNVILKELNRFDGFIFPICTFSYCFEEIIIESLSRCIYQRSSTSSCSYGKFCALSIPLGCNAKELPWAVTFVLREFKDNVLLRLAQDFFSTNEVSSNSKEFQTIVNRGNNFYCDTFLNMPSEVISLAIVGNHLSGMALNWQLQLVGASLVKKTTTSPSYRLCAFPKQFPADACLIRVPSFEDKFKGISIEVEVWNIPAEKLGKLVSLVPSPLAFGSVELDDGKWVKGFFCEEQHSNFMFDITKYGGWRAYNRDCMNQSLKPFEKVLVANRGEIAVRVIKTLKKLGIKSVAVFAEPDRYAQHVQDADESVDLNGVSAAETYLSVSKILNAAQTTAAQAIIPGYGFLSENAAFAQECEEAGITFIGPSSDNIRTLGLKHSAREIAKRVGIPLVPGTDLLESAEEAIFAGDKLGYPLMIKSTAGGGGIGLRCVQTKEELRMFFDIVKHQSKTYFNNSGIFLESCIQNPRHVEVQILGDGNGNVIALGERDCSLQRRYQKIVEETPAPNLPQETRNEIFKAAETLTKSVNYKSAGTVEFIYDQENRKFYFIEVNTRLQVEHPITEAVTGMDLVESMIYIAANRPEAFMERKIPKGVAMEVRLYAENPLKGFLPCAGQISDIRFPRKARVDTWVSTGTRISPEYDPMIAKIIIHGEDRTDTLKKLRTALNETTVYGIVTNIDYLRAIANSPVFEDAKMSTKTLDSFTYSPKALEITFAGGYTTIQDYPGRKKLWGVGLPPSGPMDSYSFRLANRIVGNHPKASAIEATLAGPTILFHCDATIAITGGISPATLDGKLIEFWKPIKVEKGQLLIVGKLVTGCRSYIAIRGGLDVPEYLNSCSTFVAANFGGLNGCVLKSGDVLFIGDSSLESCSVPVPINDPISVPPSLIPCLLKEQLCVGNDPSENKKSSKWEVYVTVGPHGAPDFFTKGSIENFFTTEWKVHYNSNRCGVRITGPKMDWARENGGEAGLHPSNTHDYVYSLGAINFTGEEPVILTCDGPTLGGFVCPVVVVEAEMWKIGQVKPGDAIKFVAISFDDAIELRKWQDNAITNLLDQPLNIMHKGIIRERAMTEDAVLYVQEATQNSPKVVYRQSGDRYILVEYGENVMDLNSSYRVMKFKEKLLSKNIDCISEISPGVRSMLIEFDGMKMTQKELLATLVAYERNLCKEKKWQVSSRIIKLPLAFEDKKTLAAVDRYRETIRQKAPWLPNNVDFLKEANGLKHRNDVRDILYSARFIVLGLGDVYLGAPCAVALDPRHRMLGTKYNPARSYTPRGGVGLGGMYLGFYGMDSPGGYQLVGRTIPIWDKFTLGQQDRPWLCSIFDQIEFFQVTEEQLDIYCEQVEHGKYVIDIQETVFDYGEYSKWLLQNKESIEQHVAQQSWRSKELASLINTSNDFGFKQMESEGEEDNFSNKAVFIYADVAGRFWKSLVSVGDKVVKGQGIVILEAMKMEIFVSSPIAGTVSKIAQTNGNLVEAGVLIAVIEP